MIPRVTNGCDFWHVLSLSPSGREVEHPLSHLTGDISITAPSSGMWGDERRKDGQDRKMWLQIMRTSIMSYNVTIDKESNDKLCCSHSNKDVYGGGGG